MSTFSSSSSVGYSSVYSQCCLDAHILCARRLPIRKAKTITPKRKLFYSCLKHFIEKQSESELKAKESLWNNNIETESHTNTCSDLPARPFSSVLSLSLLIGVFLFCAPVDRPMFLDNKTPALVTPCDRCR